MPTSSTEWTEWIQAIGTSMAVFAALGIALYQDKMRAWIMKPKLDVSIDPESPDCLKIPITNSQQGLSRITADAFYLRLKVLNKGNLRAELVEVFAESLLQYRDDNTFRKVNAFLPMNLIWADYGTAFVQAISPKIYRHCTLAHIIDPKNREKFPAEDKQWPNIPADNTILSFDTVVKPNTLSYLLPPGKYQLVILIAAANASPVKKTIEFSLNGIWYEDEKKMFQDGIHIKILHNKTAWPWINRIVRMMR